MGGRGHAGTSLGQVMRGKRRGELGHLLPDGGTQLGLPTSPSPSVSRAVGCLFVCLPSFLAVVVSLRENTFT